VPSSPPPNSPSGPASHAFVYEHADELRAIPLANSPRPRLRSAAHSRSCIRRKDVCNGEGRSLIEPGPYVRLRNFERLIHYGKRPPTWCKLYSELLRDDDFLALTFTERGILVGIWQVEASNRRTGRGKRPISRQSLPQPWPTCVDATTRAA
jgi:hypothetical protein